MAIGVEGTASLLSSIATIDFYRGVPPGGFTKGLPAHLRSDKGEGDIASGSPRHAFLRLQALSPRSRRRRGRRSRRRPTTCRRWCRAATTMA